MSVNDLVMAVLTRYLSVFLLRLTYVGMDKQASGAYR